MDHLIDDGLEIWTLDNLALGKRRNINANAELIVGGFTNASTAHDAAFGVDRDIGASIHAPKFLNLQPMKRHIEV